MSNPKPHSTLSKAGERGQLKIPPSLPSRNSLFPRHGHLPVKKNMNGPSAYGPRDRADLLTFTGPGLKAESHAPPRRILPGSSMGNQPGHPVEHLLSGSNSNHRWARRSGYKGVFPGQRYGPSPTNGGKNSWAMRKANGFAGVLAGFPLVLRRKTGTQKVVSPASVSCCSKERKTAIKFVGDFPPRGGRI
jgi:hypothetical protein